MGDQQGLWAWQRINSLFNWLPLAALIEDRIVCMDGGASCCLSCPHAIKNSSPVCSRLSDALGPSVQMTNGLPLLTLVEQLAQPGARGRHGVESKEPVMPRQDVCCCNWLVQ